MSEGKNVDMNPELVQWIKEQKKLQKEINKDGQKQKVEGKKPSGNCEICGENPAEAICIKCSRNVCKSCYFKLIHVCKKCVPPEIAGKWDGSRTDWEKELGVEWVE